MNALIGIKRQFFARFFVFVICASGIYSGYGQGTIFVEGTLPNNTNWSADTVKVTGDLFVGHLIIQPGTIIEFQGYYTMSVGSLEANGASGDTIVFTINDTTGIHNSADNTGGWGGIVLTGGSTLFNYCKIEYAKNPDGYSGAIRCDSESENEIDFLNCVITNNHTNGMLGYNGKFNFYKSVISNNTGAGIYSGSSSLKINECVIKNNLKQGLRGSSDLRVSVENSTIESNRRGGLGINEYSGCIIRNNLIQYNDNFGINAQPDWPEIKGIVENNIIRYNQGSGLVADYCYSMPVINNLVYGNSGIGIDLGEIGPMLINNTIINNAGGIATWSGVRIYNCIIRDNGSNGSITGVWPEYGLRGKIYNTNIEGITADDIEGEFVDNTDLDPMFINAANYDFQLVDNSPCINSGTADTTGLNLPLADIGGNPRVFDGRIDMGAYENQTIQANRAPRIEHIPDQAIFPAGGKSLTVKFYDPDFGDICSLTDVVSGVPEIKIQDILASSASVSFNIVADASWQGNGEIALQVADNHGKTGTATFQVVVSKSVCGIIRENTSWTSDTVKIACDVTVKSGVTLTILPGTVVEFADSCQLNVNGSVNAIGNKDARIIFTASDTTGAYNFTHTGWNGIRITGNGPAHFKYCDFSYARNDNNGGALYFSGNENMSLKITNCNFYSNYSNSGGGAVSIGGSIVEFKNNVLFNNRASEGGAIYFVTDQQDITNNLFYNNYAGEGGAFFAYYGSYRLINNTFSGNEAEVSGGAISISEGSITNCILWGNTAGIAGNQLKMTSSVSLGNSIVEGGSKGITGIAFTENTLMNNKIYAVNPDFAGMTEFNFHLTDTSMAVNNGTLDTSGLSLPFSDPDGNPRIYSGTKKIVDIGAYEFQDNPVNRKPVLFFPDQLFVNTATTKREIVKYFDPDCPESHTLSIQSDNENLQIKNLSGHTSGSYFDLVPAENWKGNTTITLKVQDVHGHITKRDCNVVVGEIVCGEINTNTTWDADTIHVVCDVTVSENAILTIMPGTVVLFHGYRTLEVLGKINALGTFSEKIVFTSDDTTGFYTVRNDGYAIETIGWNGLILNYNETENLTSVFRHCIFKYASNTALVAYFYPGIEISNCEFKYNIGGAIYAWNAGSLIKNSIFTHNTSRFKSGAITASLTSIIDSCIFRENHAAEEAGAVFLHDGDHIVTNNLFEGNTVDIGACLVISPDYYGNSRISRNVFINNTTLHRGTGAAIINSGVLFDNNLVAKNIGNRIPYQTSASGGVYIYGNPKLVNNTIAYNLTNAGGGGGICINPSSEPVIYNTILYGNKSDGIYNQIRNDGTGLQIINSDLQGGRAAMTGTGSIMSYENNLDDDPEFLVDTLKAGTPLTIDPSYLALSDYSPFINAGISDTTGLYLPLTDLDGYPRIHDGRIDMGAFEYQQDNFHILKQPGNNTVCEGTVTTIETEAIGGVTGYQWQKNGSDLPGANQALLNFDPASTTDSGYYNCIITADDQIVSTDTIFLTVKALFVMTGQSASFSMCPGKDTLLYVSTLGNKTVDYAWYKNDVLLPSSKDSILTIPFLEDLRQDTYRCVLSNSCKSETSADMEIIIHDTPELELIESLFINTGETLLIDAGSGWQSYVWNTGSEDQVLSVPGLASGIYTYNVVVTDQNNCPAYDTVHVTVAILDGIPETSGMGITLFPNPAGDILYLNTVASVEEEVTITLSDNSGKIVIMMKRDRIPENTVSPIDVSALSPGDYYLKISTRKMNRVEKIVVE